MSGPARVLVVGDALLDVDVDGRVERTTPDAGLPVLEVTGEVERRAGPSFGQRRIRRRRGCGGFGLQGGTFIDTARESANVPAARGIIGSSPLPQA